MIILQAFCMPFRYYIFIPMCIVQRTLTLLSDGFGISYENNFKHWARNLLILCKVRLTAILQYKGDTHYVSAHVPKECLEGPIILCNESCKVLVILKQQQDLISSNFRLPCVPFCVM